MKKEEMRPGDILIYDHSDAWFSKMIAYLTESKISHTALLLEDKTILEMDKVSKGITWYDFSTAPDASLKGHSHVYIMRHTDVQTFTPVFHFAHQHMASGAGFDTPLEVMLGLLLAFKKFSVSKRLYRLLKPLLLSLIHKLNEAIASLTPGEAKPMLCSEMVYHCFYKCEQPWPIRLKTRFLDGLVLPDSNLLERPQVPGNITFTEEMGQELYREYVREVSGVGACADDRLTASCRELLDYFCARVRDYALSAGTPVEVMTVLPIDLYIHTNNLELMGEADIYYE